MSTKKENTHRVFVAPGLRNVRILAKPGVLVQAPANSNSGGLPIDLRRDGDVWVEFRGGICATEDPDAIAWLEAHDGSPILDEEGVIVDYEPDICKDIKDPQAKAWTALKENTIDTANKEATLPPGTDIGKILRGDSDAFTKRNLVDTAQGR